MWCRVMLKVRSIKLKGEFALWQVELKNESLDPRGQNENSRIRTPMPTVLINQETVLRYST